MIAPSELILRPDGSLYHLNLLPGQLATDIITVGDPERVEAVSRRFDRVELKVHAREFVTHTGELDGRRISVISTGIGTDNVDIVINEIDALFNIDLKTRTAKQSLTSLNFLRLGTSGAFQADLPLDSLLLSTAALGADGLLPYYDLAIDETLSGALIDHLNAHRAEMPGGVRIVKPQLPDYLSGATLQGGITLTAAGFYAPQGRQLRLTSRMDERLLSVLRSFDYGGLRITNIEMETAGIYGLATALGHRAVSISVLLANRALGTFSSRPALGVERLIDRGLSLIVSGGLGAADAVEE